MISVGLFLGFWLFGNGLTPVFLGLNLDNTFCLKVVFLLLVYNESQPDSYIKEIKSQAASPNPFKARTLLMCFQSTFWLLMKFIMQSKKVVMFFVLMSKIFMIL